MRRATGLLVVAMVVLAGVAQAKDPAPGQKIRVLLTSGGHGFEVKPFYAMFDAMKDVQYTKAEMPKDAGLLKPGLEKQYDVIVRYDMVGKVSPEQEKAFVELLKTGIGLVALHHDLAAHNTWPEYARIIGGKYCLKPCEIGGKHYPQSTWAHGQLLKVTVADKQHPITCGVQDFTIDDETYGGYYVAPTSHVLLTTDNPKNTPQIAWTTKYFKSPVAYIMLGHDHQAYTNPNYAKLVHNAIAWAAKR